MSVLNAYDWNRIRAALSLLQESFPGLLENVVHQTFANRHSPF